MKVARNLFLMFSLFVVSCTDTTSFQLASLPSALSLERNNRLIVGSKNSHWVFSGSEDWEGVQEQTSIEVGNVERNHVAFVGDLNADGDGEIAVRATDRTCPQDELKCNKTTIQFFDSKDSEKPKFELRDPVLERIEEGKLEGEALTVALNDDRQFGLALEGGDFNGDGRGDVVVSSPHEDIPPSSKSNGCKDCGRVRIAYGHLNRELEFSDTITNPDLTNKDLRFGRTLTVADVNGDRFHDLIVSANQPRDGRNAKVYVYHGSANGLSVLPDASLDFPRAMLKDYPEGLMFNPYQKYEEEFAASISSAGDVNGDGYEDVLIGAPFSAEGCNLEYSSMIKIGCGNAFLYLGSANGLSGNPTARFAFPDRDWTEDWNKQEYSFRQKAIPKFGAQVAGIGDINGDTFSDFLIAATAGDRGCPMSSANKYVTDPTTGRKQTVKEPYVNGGCGIVYLYFGSANTSEIGNPMNVVRLNGKAEQRSFGLSIAGIADINGDGFSDFAVSSLEKVIGSNGAAVDDGRVAVYFGRKNFKANHPLIGSKDTPSVTIAPLIIEKKEGNLLLPGFGEIVD